MITIYIIGVIVAFIVKVTGDKILNKQVTRIDMITAVVLGSGSWVTVVGLSIVIVFSLLNSDEFDNWGDKKVF